MVYQKPFLLQKQAVMLLLRRLRHKDYQKLEERQVTLEVEEVTLEL